MNVLILNTGSSSVKFQIIATDLDAISRNADRRLARGSVERIGGEAVVHLENEKGPMPPTTAPLSDIRAVIDYVIRWAC
jgi:acetate kinase